MHSAVTTQFDQHGTQKQSSQDF
uniref:Uncharacterized protein n=1 Tax=Anguilla anguilla TaxID=7936 RepID=A0A0E9TL78_ANGAN